MKSLSPACLIDDSQMIRKNQTAAVTLSTRSPPTYKAVLKLLLRRAWLKLCTEVCVTVLLGRPFAVFLNLMCVHITASLH